MEALDDDQSAPDSWESVDLDESMKRLMVSSEKSADLATPAATSASEIEEKRSISDVDLRPVDQFLRNALEKPRERISILRMEQDIIKFIDDPARQQLEFEDLPTSYLRLAAHRLAQHYYLQSIAMPENILPDGSGSLIVLRKTPYCNLPPIRLAGIPVNLQQEETKNDFKVAIKQRPQRSSQTASGSNAQSSKSSGVKSVDERKEEYNKARARIFNLSFDEDLEFNLPSDLTDTSVSNNRVAVFRDREVDRKDPDYDRSYDRYVQRFDPGFGFNGGHHYTMQPMYSPAVSYNTEFPQLGSSGPIRYSPPEGMVPPFNPGLIGVYMHPSQYPSPPLPFVHQNEHVQPFSQTHQHRSESNFGLARPR